MVMQNAVGSSDNDEKQVCSSANSMSKRAIALVVILVKQLMTTNMHT